MAELRMYDLLEVAEILKLNRRTIYRYVSAGKLKAVKIGKFWRVSEENLKEFMKTGSNILDSGRRKENREH